MAGLLAEKVTAILGPKGLLDKAWPDYEPRSGQLNMALEVARAFENRDFGLIEAGTGTGKTLAYLLPALLSGLKTVVSTGTKNLQEQIFTKDIPFIQRQLGSGFRAAYLKGRENYLCLFLFRAFLRDPAFVVPREAVYLDSLAEWARNTDTGDRAELTDFPEDFLTWSELSAPGDRCLGGKCPDFQDCFLQRARRAAARADMVIVNHHLFMADLSIRGHGHGEVIPEYDAVIFDEAHQLEDVATQHFGRAVSTYRLAWLKRDIERTVSQTGSAGPMLLQSLAALVHQAEGLSRFFIDRDEIELWTTNHPDMEKLRILGLETLATLEGIESLLKELTGKNEEIEGVQRRTATLVRDLAHIIEGRDSMFVYWAERRGKGLFLRSSPVDVSPFLQKALYEQGIPVVFTSATLSTSHSFDYFKGRLGLLPEVEGVQVGSPFDYREQTLFYVPRPFPYPQSPAYLPSLVEEIEKLLTLTRGRAFVLFTSYRNLNYAAERLAGRLPWVCLVQGQAPRNSLLERFREETSSVLLATHSFWQGVDVPGESLSAVIIDKLPFPRPDGPLVKARSDRLKEEGRDPFFDFMVPDAIITLKQGLGRLIRTRSDRGLLAVLDYRLLGKGYGKRFFESLPDSRLTHDLATVEAFFEDY